MELVESFSLDPDLDLDKETQGPSGDNNEWTNNMNGIWDIGIHFLLFANLFLCNLVFFFFHNFF